MGTTALGNKWLSGHADMYLIKSGTNVSLLFNAASQTVFTGSGTPVTYSAPGDTYYVLTADAANKKLILTDKTQNLWISFNDFTVTNVAWRGKPLEISTLQWHAQGKSGFQYSYNTGGTISQITGPTGQDYNLAFTYNASGWITKIQVSNASSVLLQQVDYTYYDDVTSPSTDIGTSGDLVQVKVSRKSTTDTGTTLSMVRYTQYRYGSGSALKAVYEHDAIQRIMSSLSLSTPETVLQKADTFGTIQVQNFASRSFTYYTADMATSSINTPFTAGENLNTTYGGSEQSETGYVKTETIGGCGGCGTTGSFTKTYFYMSLANSTTDQNQVTRLVVEDTQDASGASISRSVFALENKGRLLRRAFIQNPTGSPIYWCESWKMATSGQPYRVSEYRKPSAHTGVTTAANLRNFLNPYDGTSWSNDSGTLNTSAGAIEVYGYDSNGMQTDVQIKMGSGGTAYYLSAADYGDGTNVMLKTKDYAYPAQTTTRSNGKQTSYSYTFYDSSTHQQIKTKTTTLPTISTGQNGSGVATTTAEYYDSLGRLRWTQDGEGYVNYYSYHPVSGGLAYQAVDVDPASPGSDITSGSSGNWDAVTVGSASSNEPTRSGSLPTVLVLATKTYYDGQGRLSQTTDRGGAKHYTVYTNTQTITFPYWDSGSGQSLTPIQVTNLNTGAQISDNISVKASYTAISTSSGAPTGFSTAPAQGDYVTWTHHTYDGTTGWLTYTDRYFVIPSSGAGTLSTNYYRTVTQYDTLGRKQYLVEVIRGSASNDRVEQVAQWVYDVKDRVIEVKKGVSGDAAANSQDMTDSYNSYPTLVTISKTVFDNGGVGDGYATKVKNYFGTGTNDFTGTNYELTYRGHIRGLEPFYMNSSTETPIGSYTVNDVNWTGRATTTALFDTDPTWSSVLTGDGYTAYASSTSSHRRTQQDVVYDDLGRVYQTKRYEISASSGTGSNYLSKMTYYDRNDRQVASGREYASGIETAYDGAGRQYQSRVVIALQSTHYSSGAFQYCAPTPNPSLSSMSGGDASVLQLTRQTLDANGNSTEEDIFEDNHDDIIGMTPGINLTNNNDYVRSTIFKWYDSAARLTTNADYGSGDTASGAGTWKYASIPSRPGSTPTASSNTALVTLYSYNSDSGLLQTVPDAAGTPAKTFYDALGRKTYVAENWSDFSPPSTGTGDATDKSKDRVTNYVYDGPSRLQQLVAMDANADGSLSDNQVTTYLYEDAVDANRKTNEIYPDSTDTTSSGTNQVKLQYNVDGTLSQRTDQRGTVIGNSYTSNRLPSIASVSTLGTGVDGTVRSIVRTYDNMNRVQNVTSYGSTGGTGTVINDIQYAYNDFGQVAASYQSHNGAVNTSTSLSVQYTYDATTTSSVFSAQHRLQTVVYPNGRVVYYDCGSSGSAYNALSTVREIWDTSPSGTGLAVYDYNGAGSRLAVATYPQPSFKLDLFQGTSGTYVGLDRFGRTVDQYWKGFNTTSDVDRIHYAYDYAGNRTYRDIDSAIYTTNDRDQAYTYDGLHRLATSQQGTLASGTISGTPTVEEDWALDALGNWPNYVQKAAGTTTLNQGRTFNPANEISGVSASVGTTWATPTYDLAGNMTTIPKPTALTSSYTAIYDAWNRLVSLADGSTTIATYAYDGLNRRMVKGLYSSGSLDHNEHAYFNEAWQILEVRKETGGTQNSNPLEQYVWHPVYVDSLVTRDYDATTSGTQTRYYYAFDANFNVTAVTTNTGTAMERYSYSPYGGLTFLDGTFTVLTAQLSQLNNSVIYTGRQYDPESGLYQFRNRFYHAQSGLFLARDSLAYRDSLNLYLAFLDNPQNATDPSGNECETITCRCGRGDCKRYQVYEVQTRCCFIGTPYEAECCREACTNNGGMTPCPGAPPPPPTCTNTSGNLRECDECCSKKLERCKDDTQLYCFVVGALACGPEGAPLIPVATIVCYRLVKPSCEREFQKCRNACKDGF